MRNEKLDKIWTDLDHYRDFCVEYGYVFDERHLYKARGTPYEQYIKLQDGRRVRDNWNYDAKRFKKERFRKPMK